MGADPLSRMGVQLLLCASWFPGMQGPEEKREAGVAEQMTVRVTHEEIDPGELGFARPLTGKEHCVPVPQASA